MPTPSDSNGMPAGPTAEAEIAACTIGSTPQWGPSVARDLITTLLSAGNPFPCTFAVAAAKKRALRFGFVESAHDDGTWGPLVDILSSYLECYQELGKDTSLVVFFRPDEHALSLDEYFQRFWSVLQFLHEKDPEPWPGAVPTDPQELMWEFSFGGTEIFVVCNTPGHVTRHSRNSQGFMITFQPRWVFEGLEADSPRGAKARKVIRNRIRRFDGMEPAPELGNYGEEGNLEWRQYFLPDTPEGTVPACPFRAGREHRTELATDEEIPEHKR
ncbi:YqcI/YcgG family protein [Streptomyces sp. NBC_01089]|uniref:YqcI/YcgG family protein n=1 Tax=Streptomyces sp. NBC_01089 TaxID=2903747 RepID=UPI00386EDD30|nr:YqcI/YcgG family protein [Streptomyces sp. NBC_01089]